ncbi:DUF2147 domain-containing protein [soil metagenome]
MKKRVFIVIVILFAATCSLWAQAEADAILGVWESGSGKARIKIDKVVDKYFGKIVWLKEPNNEEGKPKVDKNNPEEKLRAVPLLGYKMLREFSYKGEKTWEDGTIYDPENGSTYSCTIKMTDENTLEVRGFIGVSLFGRTDEWKRIQLRKK